MFFFSANRKGVSEGPVCSGSEGSSLEIVAPASSDVEFKYSWPINGFIHQVKDIMTEQTDGLTDWRTVILTDRRKDRQMGSQKDTRTERQKKRQTDSQVLIKMSLDRLYVDNMLAMTTK